MIYKNEFGVKTNIIRPFNVYGPECYKKTLEFYLQLDKYLKINL